MLLLSRSSLCVPLPRHLAVVQHINSVRVLNRRKAVRDDEKRFAPDDFGDRLSIFSSFSGSANAVASSRMTTGAFFRIALASDHSLPLPARKRAAAIARERINTVFKSIYKFHALRFLRRGKYFLFCRIRLADLDIIVNARVDRKLSCDTKEMRAFKASRLMSVMSCPPKVIFPLPMS